MGAVAFFCADVMTANTQSFRIATPRGGLQVQRWQPVAVASDLGAVAAAPIVLLHDSLGSVALWRDFPAQRPTPRSA